MSNSILVTYATRHGSTQEVAEVVTATLRECELTVDLQPLRKVRTPAGYSAVVLGAPLYMFHWHKDALRFLSQHQNVFSSDVPIAIFAGGPMGTGAETEWQEVRKQLDRELVKFPWLSPIAVEVIGGRFDPAKLRFPYNLIPALRQMPACDLRDWTAIRTWANNLAAQLQLCSHNKEKEQ